ncbi:MAG: cohesin domain-containing protein, partial [Acidobacteria bacterium]|nr:cohesin domain-containing protein [Acidobacteriota bacterium]
VIADFAASCLNGDSCSTNAVTSQKGNASGNVVEVQLWLNKLNTTIGEASLDVGFDQTVADYQGYTEGPALGTSGTGTVYLVTEVGPGEVLVDIAPPVGGKSVSSATRMVTLSFKLLKTSAGSNFSFRNPDTLNGSALYTSGATPTIILLTPAKWTGGLFSGM